MLHGYFLSSHLWLWMQWIDGVLSSGQEVEFFHDEFRCPVYVKDMVNVILTLIKKWITGICLDQEILSICVYLYYWGVYFCSYLKFSFSLLILEMISRGNNWEKENFLVISDAKSIDAVIFKHALREMWCNKLNNVIYVIIDVIVVTYGNFVLIFTLNINISFFIFFGYRARFYVLQKSKFFIV